MATLTCKRCRTGFDTDREPATKGADTSRCPSCGETHTDAEVTAATIKPATDGGTASSAIEIQLTVRVSGVDNASDLSVSVED